MSFKINDFAYFNEKYRIFLSVWLDDVFDESMDFLFDTRLGDEQDSFGDSANEFMGYITEASHCRLIEIYHHPDGPHILHVHRANGKHRWGSMQQIELAMRFGKLESIRCFAKGESRYTFSFSRISPNPYDNSSSICQADLEWPTQKACLEAIDRILRLNPAHAVTVTTAN